MARVIDVVQVKAEIAAEKLAVIIENGSVLLKDMQSGEAVFSSIVRFSVFAFLRVVSQSRYGFSVLRPDPSPLVRGGYFFDPATIFRQSSRVSSSGFAPFGRR